MTNYRIIDDGGAVVGSFAGTIGDQVAVFAYGPGHTAGLYLTQFIARAAAPGALVAGTYGDAATVPQITVNALGVITAIKAVPIQLSSHTLMATVSDNA